MIVGIVVGSIILITFVYFVITSEKSKNKSNSTVFKDAKVKVGHKKKKVSETKQIRPEIIRTSDKIQDNEIEFNNEKKENIPVNNQTKNMFVSEQTNFEKINPEFDRVVSLDEINADDKVEDLEDDFSKSFYEQEDSLKDQINSLSPTMKALLVSDILDSNYF